MTLKNIDFYDSPVMRELARLATEKGTVSKPSVAEVVKNASAKEPVYSPSDNVFLDVVRLIDGLRSKGMVREAEVLEYKFLAYKRAEKEFSDILDDAHPDGDTEMGEAKDGLGVVETLESQHSKILEVINKNPTGKNAALAQEITRKVASVLLKNAQDGESYEQLMGLETEEAKNQKAQSVSRAQRVEEINNTVASSTVQIRDGIKAVKQTLYSLSFDSAQISRSNEPYLQLYASKAQLDPEEIKKFGVKWDSVYGAGVSADPNIIYKRILSYGNDVQQVVAYTDLVSPGIFKKYFPPPKEEFKTNWEQAKSDAVKMVGDMVGGAFVGYLADREKSSEKTRALVTEMHSTMVAQLNAYVGKARVDAATKVLREDIKKWLTPLDQVDTNLASVPTLNTDAKSNFPVTSVLKVSQKLLTDFVKAASKNVEFANVVKIMVPEGTSVWEQSSVVGEKLNELVNTINKLPLSTGDNLVTEESALAISGGFGALAKKLSRFTTSTYPKGSQQYNDYALDVRMFSDIRDVMAKAGNKSYIEIYSGIQQYLPKATTLDKLQEIMGGYVAALDKLVPPTDSIDALNPNIKFETTVTDAAAAKDGLQKVSARLTPGGGAAPAAPVTGKKPGATYNAPSAGGRAPAPPGVGMTPVNLADPAQNAVAKMQMALNSLGYKINNDPKLVQKLLGTGHPKHPYLNQLDGKWGPSTQAALGAANTIPKMNLGLDTRARWENPGGYKNPEEVEQVATENTTKLMTALQQLGGAGVGEQGAAGPTNKVVTYGRLNGVYITNADLASLRAFYRFVVKNKFIQEVSTVNEQASGKVSTGVPYPGFVALLGNVVTDAKSNYNESDPASAHYYQDAMNLWRQLADIARRFKWGTNDEGVVVPFDTLPGEGGVGGAGSQGGAPGGKGKQPGATYQAKPGEGGEDLEGTQWRRREKKLGTIFPINPESANIDLSSQWYENMAEQFNIPDILSFNLFRDTPGPVLAEMLFPGSASPNDQFAGFLNALRKQVSAAVVQWGRDGRGKFNSDDIAYMTELLRDWNQAITRKLAQLSKRPVG